LPPRAREPSTCHRAGWLRHLPSSTSTAGELWG
jgi:hypothetical protein